MLKAINNRNSASDTRDWMTIFLGCADFSSIFASRKERDESKPKPPWKQFDDSHHWDSIADEWIPNDLK
jgi:hypothetical protein